jgi:HSP20 family protein
METMSAATEIANTPVVLLLVEISSSGLAVHCCVRYKKPISDSTGLVLEAPRPRPGSGGNIMLLRTTDPFRDFDRLTQQLLGSTNRPVVMPMDAWREGDRFVIEFDLPGVRQESIDLDVERNVLTVSAERISRNGDWEMLASERPRGRFSRQLVLGDNLDLDRIEAAYEAGVLRLIVPVAERARPRKIQITGSSDQPTSIEA